MPDNFDVDQVDDQVESDVEETLEGDLDDGTGIVTLVWLGRRHIVGIEPGRALTVTGRIGLHDGRRVLYNPRYELMP